MWAVGAARLSWAVQFIIIFIQFLLLMNEFIYYLFESIHTKSSVKYTRYLLINNDSIY